MRRFNWSDGKLNSSNLIELSGQITEKFDEEFRILYAQSLPVNTQRPPSVRNSGIYDHLLIKNLVTSSPHLASTPSRKLQTLEVQPPCEPSTAEAGRKAPGSNSSTIGEEWEEQQRIQEEILAGSAALRFPADKVAEKEIVTPSAVHCHVSTQTSWSMADRDSQADLQCTQQPNHILSTATENQAPSPSSAHPKHTSLTSAAPDGALKDCFTKLTKERQHYYSNIRHKLEDIVTSLSQRREVTDITNMTQWASTYSRQKIQQDYGPGPNPRMLAENVGTGTGTWPRARCVY